MLQSLFLVLTNNELDEKFNNFPTAFKATKTGVLLFNKIESNKNTAIGKPIIPFSQVGIDGQIINLENFKGKVVLIDFWEVGVCRVGSVTHRLKNFMINIRIEGLKLLVFLMKLIVKINRTKIKLGEKLLKKTVLTGCKFYTIHKFLML